MVYQAKVEADLLGGGWKFSFNIFDMESGTKKSIFRGEQLCPSNLTEKEILMRCAEFAIDTLLKSNLREE